MGIDPSYCYKLLETGFKYLAQLHIFCVRKYSSDLRLISLYVGM